MNKIIITISGPCGSGKTMLACMIKGILTEALDVPLENITINNPDGDINTERMEAHIRDPKELGIPEVFSNMVVTINEVHSRRDRD
jgi:ABC-type uncharacterized transport system YnjBCD ATPase subunit